MTNKIFSLLKVVTLAIVLSFGLSYVYAWTAPTVTPTGGNVLAPLNTSGTAQTKNGGLTVSSITAPSHCIGASCITTWPTSGATPPTGSTFLDTSGTAQTKDGNLSVSGNIGIGATSPGAKLSFGDLNDGRNTADGITWYNPSPRSYGIYRTVGSWLGPDYQQLRLAWDTGIVIDGGSAYGKSGTVLQPNGGNVGIGTTNPTQKLDVNGDIVVSGALNFGYEIVTKSAYSAGHFSVDVYCPVGKKVLGGGCNQEAGGNRGLVDNNPIGNNGWHCRNRDIITAQAVTATTYAICARVQ